MKPRFARCPSRSVRPLLAGLLLLASGCSLPLPQAQPDLTRYFVLQEGVKAPAAAPQGPARVVRIDRVDVPAYLLDKPMAVRRGPNEIRYLDAARWAEPLDQNLARNLLLGLNACSGVRAVSRGSLTEQWDYNLRVQVTACEGDEAKHAAFTANWVLQPAPGSSGQPKSGAFVARDLAWDGASADSLAAALSQGVTQLCEAVGAAAAAQP